MKDLKTVGSGKITVLIVGITSAAIVISFSAIMQSAFGLDMRYDIFLKCMLITICTLAAAVFKPARSIRGVVTLTCLILCGCLATFIVGRSLRAVGHIPYSAVYLILLCSFFFMCMLAVNIWRKGW